MSRDRTVPESEATRIPGVPVKEAARILGKPPSTLYDWIARGWIGTIRAENDRGRELTLIPISEIERLRGVGSDPEPTGTDSGTTVSESVPTPEPVPPASESDRIPTGTETDPAYADLLALVREQFDREREEKEALRRENLQLVHRIGALEERAEERLKALAVGQSQVAGEVTALAVQVTAIERRAWGVGRRVQALTALVAVIAILSAVVGGLSLRSAANPRSRPPSAQSGGYKAAPGLYSRGGEPRAGSPARPKGSSQAPVVARPALK